ncbi:MAG TPA: hypothetical protein VF535_13385 [Allosphingosinicella sp.]
MTEPLLDVWERIAGRAGFERGSPEEETFVRENFGLSIRTFNSNLSRGFSWRRQRVAVYSVCEAHGEEVDREAWFGKSHGGGATGTRDQLSWIGPRVLTPEDFFQRLPQLYGAARHYRCLRVGGRFSRNRAKFRQFDERGLALKPEEPSIRMPYLITLWNRVRERQLWGESVHIVKTIDRLVELWACVERVQKLKIEEKNPVYLAPVTPLDLQQDYPAMGVRIIDGDNILFSLPALPNDVSSYSSWIESPRLAAFAREYISRAQHASEDLTIMTPVGLRQLMENAFEALRPTLESKTSNYGLVDSFEKLEIVKDRMATWDERLWLPVFA